MQSKYSRLQPAEGKLAWFLCREEGMSLSQICELFRMSRKTYFRWRKRCEEEWREERGSRFR
jgi:DNA-directed RNA polymerase specialized sigma24 family protein